MSELGKIAVWLLGIGVPILLLNEAVKAVYRVRLMDRFANSFIQGFMAGNRTISDNPDPKKASNAVKEIAESAYVMARALMEQRPK